MEKMSKEELLKKAISSGEELIALLRTQLLLREKFQQHLLGLLDKEVRKREGVIYPIDRKKKKRSL